MLGTQFHQEVQHRGKSFFLSVSFLCKLDTTALYEIFCYGDSFDVLISSSTVLRSGLFFSLLNINYIQVFQFGTTRYKVKESVYICLFYPAHLAIVCSAIK